MRRIHVFQGLTVCITLLILVWVCLIVCKFLEWNAFFSNDVFPVVYRLLIQELLRQMTVWVGIFCLGVSLLVILLFLGAYFKKEQMYQTVVPVDGFGRLNVDEVKGVIVYGTIEVKCRRQVLRIINHLLDSDGHSMSYEDLNEILGAGFYDGTYSSQKKANNLKYELKRALDGMPFVLCPSTPNQIRLMFVAK